VHTRACAGAGENMKTKVIKFKQKSLNLTKRRRKEEKPGNENAIP
jgi:hypothetical protein